MTQRVLSSAKRAGLRCWLNGFVVLDPVLYIGLGEVMLTDAADNARKAGIDDHSAAHCAGRGVMQQFAGLCVTSHKVKRAADHISSGSGDDSVCLGVDAAAQFIPLAGRNAQLLSVAVSQLRAVDSSARCAVISGGEDLIIFYDDGTVFSAHAGGTPEDGICNVQIIVFLIDALVQIIHRFL